MTETGTVAWFDLAKQFGFVALSNGLSTAVQKSTTGRRKTGPVAGALTT